MINKVQNLIIHKKLMKIKGYIDILALGCCMTPFLRDHDILRVVPVNAFYEGQIVVICFADSLKAHRVITVNHCACTITTKGDNAINAEIVDFSNVIGVVTGVYRESQWIWFEYSYQDCEIAKLSKSVNDFYKCCGSIEKTMLSNEYRTLLLCIKESLK